MTENASLRTDVSQRVSRPIAIAMLDPGHADWLERIALRHRSAFGDVVEVEELVSVGFLALRRAAELFDPARRVPFRAFAFPRVDGAMIREIGQRLEWVRRCRRMRRVDPEREPADCDLGRLASSPIVERRSPEALLEERRDREVLRSALAELDGLEHTVLTARYIDGMSLRDIARWLGIGYSTVRRRHRRGLDVLREALTNRGRATPSTRSSRAARSRSEPRSLAG